jgi:NADH-quinone oxidoreductase subunit L
VAIFHLVTHAFFKALMFLGSGSVIHACDGEQDMRKMGGLRRYMPITFITFVCGTLAISGVPIFSGFFSKDEILWQTAATGNWPLYIIALGTAGLTATYMGRLVWLTFFGENRSSKHVREHLHESPLVMTIPLMILAVLATFGGFLSFPGEHNFLEHLLHGIVPENLGHGAESLEYSLMALSVCVGAGCLYLSYILYGRKYKEEKETSFTSFLYNSWYLNELYEAAVVRPLGQLAIFLWKVVDVIFIDGAVLLTATVSRVSGRTLRRIHTGHLEHYLAFLLVGMIALLLILVSRAL